MIEQEEKCRVIINNVWNGTAFGVRDDGLGEVVFTKRRTEQLQLNHGDIVLCGVIPNRNDNGRTPWFCSKFYRHV